MIVQDHAREAARLASIASYRLEGLADPAIDHVVSLAARLTGMPMAGLSIVDADRQWMAAQHGMRQGEVARELAFCDHVVRSGQALVVPDTRAEPRFRDNPFVTEQHVRAYVGMPVVGRDGLTLGALCVLSREPHDVTEAAVTELARLSRLVSQLLDLHRADAEAGLAAVDVLADSHRLRRAIDSDELVVHYQPVVHLGSGRMVGVEALVRWGHPQRGLLPPSQFLPLAERSGLVVAVDRLVLSHAARQVATWRRDIPAAATLRLAVNLSARQLGDATTPATVQALLQDAGLPATALTVELTETSHADQASAVSVMQSLRDAGCRVSLDDFGTGYASLAYLQRFVVDEVKLDRSFVSALGDGPAGEDRTSGLTAGGTSPTCGGGSRGGGPGASPMGSVPHPAWGTAAARSAQVRGTAIAAAAVALAAELRCHVVAEGVERRDQVSALQVLGCQYAQGYLFSTPRTAADLELLLRGR